MMGASLPQIGPQFAVAAPRLAVRRSSTTK
jgi:hypothetical protein